MKHLALHVANNRTPVMEAFEKNEDYKRTQRIPKE